MKKTKKTICLFLIFLLTLSLFSGISRVCAKAEESVTIRVSNWEEYIDLGDWDEEETIHLESGDIIGENSMVDDFKEWYYETYGIRVNVEYSTFGTNEDLYNMLTLGDVYDLICPSEYMVMKLMMQNQLVPLSDDFFNQEDENNYYSRMVSPFIRNIMNEKGINGESWAKYMAGYMWGITGIVYDPKVVTKEEASTWKILANPKFDRQITLKDNVRDSYFAAVGAIKSDLLTDKAFLEDPDYASNLEKEMNDISDKTIAQALGFLKKAKENAYSFETDSGKADLITGKIIANLQWSGDGVYSINQAQDVDRILNFAVPKEATNIYFDGWVMLKSGIGEDKAKQHACEAFINFLSRPDNVIRNMYYIGYTSVIAGNEEDSRIFEYADSNYGADEGEEDVTEYPLGYFFSGEKEDKNYILTASTEQLDRQLFAAYPDAEALSRASIMAYFDEAANEKINQMWVNVRCLSVRNIPVWGWVIAAVCILAIVLGLIRKKNQIG